MINKLLFCKPIFEMKYLIILLTPVFGFSQTDTIFAKDGKVIITKIGLVNDQNVFYMHKKGYEEIIHLTKIASYVMEGKRTIVDLDKLGLRQTFDEIKTDSTNGLIVFTEVVKADSASKAELYSKAREWFALNFKSADAVLEMDDKESGKLIGKAWQNINTPLLVRTTLTKIFYTIKIQLKDNRYKYTITNIYYKSYPNQLDLDPQSVFAEDIITDEQVNAVKPKIRNVYRTETLRVMNELSESIKNGMKSNSSAKVGEW